MGQGFKFRPGIFDGAISVSVLQWIFVASKKDQNPYRRIHVFFQSLYTCLAAGARAIFQFYPDGSQQLEMCVSAAVKAGFKAAVVVDYPDSKRRKKIYLALCAGDGDLSNIRPLLSGMEEYDEIDEEEEKGEERLNVLSQKSKKIQKYHHKDDKPNVKTKEWILKKKERQRKQGKDVRKDTKYSGRKRNQYF
jgi:18S rRNA (guanine1575-N7)-methyltransferase